MLQKRVNVYHCYHRFVRWLYLVLLWSTTATVPRSTYRFTFSRGVVHCVFRFVHRWQQVSLFFMAFGWGTLEQSHQGNTFAMAVSCLGRQERMCRIRGWRCANVRVVLVVLWLGSCEIIVVFFAKMLFVSCPFLKETPMRIDDSCIFAYELKGKILSALVSSVFAHWRFVYFDVTEMVSLCHCSVISSIFGYWCYVNTLMPKCNPLSIMN